jgi:hypothetical protein
MVAAHTFADRVVNVIAVSVSSICQAHRRAHLMHGHLGPSLTYITRTHTEPGRSRAFFISFFSFFHFFISVSGRVERLRLGS